MSKRDKMYYHEDERVDHEFENVYEQLKELRGLIPNTSPFKFAIGEYVRHRHLEGIYQVHNSTEDKKGKMYHCVATDLEECQEEWFDGYQDHLSPVPDEEIDDLENGITRNEDGSYNIPVDLDHNTIAKLAIEAHEMGITLNDYMIMVVTDYANKTLDENS